LEGEKLNLEEKLIGKKIVYQGKYLRTEEHHVKLPDGKETKREVVVTPDAVGILAFSSSEQLYMVRQFRVAIQKITLEIPAGILEPGEDPIKTAERECEEEIGMTPKKLDPLFSFYHSVGFSTGKIKVYLADDLTPCHHSKPDSHEFLEVATLPFEEVFQKVFRGEIVDSKTLIALLWYNQIKQNEGK
jgi:ADP-ribose pyrophosphatase